MFAVADLLLLSGGVRGGERRRERGKTSKRRRRDEKRETTHTPTSTSYTAIQHEVSTHTGEKEAYNTPRAVSLRNIESMMVNEVRPSLGPPIDLSALSIHSTSIRIVYTRIHH